MTRVQIPEDLNDRELLVLYGNVLDALRARGTIRIPTTRWPIMRKVCVSWRST